MFQGRYYYDNGQWKWIIKYQSTVMDKGKCKNKNELKELTKSKYFVEWKELA